MSNGAVYSGWYLFSGSFRWLSISRFTGYIFLKNNWNVKDTWKKSRHRVNPVYRHILLAYTHDSLSWHGNRKTIIQLPAGRIINRSEPTGRFDVYPCAHLGPHAVSRTTLLVHTLIRRRRRVFARKIAGAPLRDYLLIQFPREWERVHSFAASLPTNAITAGLIYNDVGTRYAVYIWTLLTFLRVASAIGIIFIFIFGYTAMRREELRYIGYIHYTGVY